MYHFLLPQLMLWSNLAVGSCYSILLSESIMPSFEQAFKSSYSRIIYLSISSLYFLASCGGFSSSITNYEKICQPQKSHPQVSYIVQQSQGDTIEEARKRASAELTRQLSAELRSELIVTSQSGQTADSSSVSDQVKEKVELFTHFKHAELIKPIAKCEYCLADHCQSSVALKRDELARRLVKEINSDVKRLKASAQDLNPQTSLLRFTQAWYIAQASSQRIEPTLNQLKVIQRITKDLLEIESLMKDAQKQRAQREENLWIGISNFDLRSKGQFKVPNVIQEALKGGFSQALETMGLKYWAQENCPVSDSQQDVIMMTPSGELHCSLGFIGPQCKLQLGISLSLCHQGKLSDDVWNKLKLVGVHPRDTQGALDKLLKSIKEADFSAPLSKSLSPFIIL